MEKHSSLLSGSINDEEKSFFQHWHKADNVGLMVYEENKSLDSVKNFVNGTDQGEGMMKIWPTFSWLNGVVIGK